MFGPRALKPVPQVVRKEVRKNPESSAVTTANGVRLNNFAPRPPPRGPPSNRFQLTQSTKPWPVKRAVTTAPQESRKRKKSSTPSVALGSDESTDEEQRARKLRFKKDKELEQALDPDRHIRDRDRWQTGEEAQYDLIHCVDVTTGPHAKDFLPIFEEQDVDVLLRYPSCSQPERFRMVKARERDAYDPGFDVSETIRSVIKHYLPQPDSEFLLDDSSGVLRSLRRGIKDKDLASYKAAVARYNTAIEAAMADGSVAARLDKMCRLQPALIERILTQVYSRTVSPRINELKAYSAGSDNVYGELMYDFCSQIFRDTGLKSKHIFLDLGSGVGNVVLQAALEVGCESWGIEMMPAASDLAAAQAKEFAARARLWGLHSGSVRLLTGDFFKHPDLHAVLRRADVVLVNNQAFQPETNARLLNNVLLDLKEGARLVSLRSFGPDFKLTRRTSENPVACFEMHKKRFYSNWVSWTNADGEYTLATKDSARVARFLQKDGGV